MKIKEKIAVKKVKDFNKHFIHVRITLQECENYYRKIIEEVKKNPALLDLELKTRLSQDIKVTRENFRTVVYACKMTIDGFDDTENVENIVLQSELNCLKKSFQDLEHEYNKFMRTFDEYKSMLEVIIA